MTTFTTSDPRQNTRPDVEAYIRRCVSYFDDLPLDDRVGLEHDVREIVSEVTAELDGSPADLVGSPRRFAAELRSAAGLPPLQEESHAAPPSGKPSLTAVFVRWLRSVAGPWVVQMANELRPAWWVARGFGLAIAFDHDHLWNGSGLVPNLFYSNLLGLIATVIFIIGSVQVGRRGRPKTSLSLVVVGLLSLLAIATIYQDIGQAAMGRYGSPAPINGDVVSEASAVMDLPDGKIDIGPLESAFVVLDAVTGEVVFRSSEIAGDDLIEILESTSINSSHGFLVESYGSTGVVQGTVPTWGGVIALAATYSEPGSAAPEPIEVNPAE